MSIEFHVPPVDALRLILASVTELTKLRQDECKHLAIENFAPELLRNMLRAYYEDAGVTITTDRETPAEVIERLKLERGIRSGSVSQNEVSK